MEHVPVHTHERRMEVYFYFDIDEEQTLVPLLWEPGETGHIVVHNEQAVINPVVMVDPQRSRHEEATTRSSGRCVVRTEPTRTWTMWRRGSEVEAMGYSEERNSPWKGRWPG